MVETNTGIHHSSCLVCRCMSPDVKSRDGMCGCHLC